MPGRCWLAAIPIAAPCEGGKTSGCIGATALKQAGQEVCAQASQSQDESLT